MCCFEYALTDHENGATAALQDRLIGALIGLARATDGNEHLISESSTAVIVESLLVTRNAENSDAVSLGNLLLRVEAEKRNMVPDCFTCAAPCGRNNAYDMDNLWNADEDVRSLKLQLLSIIRAIAAYAHSAAILGHHREDVDRFFYKALIVIGMDGFGPKDLLPIVQEADEMKRNTISELKSSILIQRASPSALPSL